MAKSVFPAAGGWFKADAYRVVDGTIRPQGRVETYDPWPTYPTLDGDAESQSVSSELLNLVEHLEKTHGEWALEQGRLSEDAVTLVTNWCAKYGLLGVLPHRIQTIVLPAVTVRVEGQRTPVPEIRIAWRAGGEWMRDAVRYPEVRTSSGAPWVVGEQVPSVKPMPNPYVILHDGFCGFGKPASVSVLLPFFPALHGAPGRPVSLPLPFERRFLEEYSEPLRDFIAAAKAFADAVRPMQADPEALRALVAPVNPAGVRVSGDTFEWRWSSTSLLGTLGVMALLDEARDCPLGRCEWASCRKVFARRVRGKRYCCRTHQKNAEMARFRSKGRTRLESGVEARKEDHGEKGTQGGQHLSKNGRSMGRGGGPRVSRRKAKT